MRGEQGSLCATALALKSEENVWESGSLLPPCGTQELNAGQDGLLPSTFNGRAISAPQGQLFDLQEAEESILGTRRPA